MIIDSHIHLEPEIFTQERMLACMDKQGIDKALLIAAVNEPFYSSGSWFESTLLRMVRRSLYRVNTAGGYLYEMMLDNRGHFITPTGKCRIYEKPDNAPVARAINQNPGRFMGWIFVNPSVEGDPLAELEKWSDNRGMVGVKAHPFFHRYPVSELDDVALWCKERGCPILVHLGFTGGTGDYRRLPEKYPGLKVIYAHAGIPYFRKLWSFIKDKEDVYVDLSCIGWLDGVLMREAVNFLGADKCLYGTDGPYGPQQPGEDFDYGLIKGLIEALPLPESQIEKIFSKNFERLIQL